MLSPAKVPAGTRAAPADRLTARRYTVGLIGAARSPPSAFPRLVHGSVFDRTEHHDHAGALCPRSPLDLDVLPQMLHD